MVVVLVLFALMLGVAGLGLIGLGFVMAVQGEVGAGLFGLAVGALVLYGAYLFARASWPTRQSLLSAARVERAEIRKRALAAVAYVVAAVASSVFMPAPTPLRVIGAITALLVLPIILARDFEPPKDRTSRHN